MTKSVVLVGPNGAGKTTLGHQLAGPLGLPYVHAGPSPGGFEKALSCTIDQFNLLNNGVILDRITPICERVYNPKMSTLKYAILYYLALQIPHRSTIIYCTADGPVQDKDYYPEGHYEAIISNREKIRSEYDRVLRDIPHISYNWKTEKLDSLMRRLHEEVHSL